MKKFALLVGITLAVSWNGLVEGASCGKAFHLDGIKQTSASFSMGIPSKAPKCIWEIFGDLKCHIEVTCKVDVKKSDKCKTNYVRVTDGSAGSTTVCGKTDITKVRASEGLRDMYVVMEVADPDAGLTGVQCTARCTSGGATPLPKNVERKIDDRCVCGFQNKDDRIVGGEDALVNEFPWQAAVVYANTRSPNCGGTIINDRFVLTAAHCFWFDEKKPSEIDVLVYAHVLDMTKKKGAKDVALGRDGSIRSSGYNLEKKTDEDEKTQRFKVTEIINHPFFTEFYDYDYALLRLDKKINLGHPTAPTPVCLPSADTFDKFDYTGKNATVVGWGMAAENAGGTTRVLQKLEVPFIPDGLCNKWMPGMLTQRMVCAGYEDGSKDACTGDSGGPLIHLMPETKQWSQLGIVSWGEGCARAKKPGVYSRVTEMMQWVDFHTQEQESKWCKETKSNN